MVWKVLGVVLYLAVLMGIGVVASRRVKDVADYFAGGKKLGFLAVAFSARATGESAWLLLGLTGMGAMFGVRGFWVVLGEVVGVGVAWILMSRRFHRLTMRHGSITVPDYLESRFRDPRHMLRIFAALALSVFVTIYVSAQIHATGQAFHTFLGMDYFVGAILGFSVVILYSMLGGFLAVVWSDVFQGALMFLGLVLLPVVAFVALGGWDPVHAKLIALDPALLQLGGADGWTLMTVCSTAGLALIGLGFMGSPQIFVRFLALRDEAEIPKGTIVAIVWTLLADSGAVLTGMLGRVWLTDIGQDVEVVLGKGGEDVLPMLVEVALPAMLVGLFIAIVMSAIMSTVDSLLVLASSAVVRDLYQKVLRTDLRDDQLVPISRITTVVLGLVSLAVAMVVAVVTDQATVFWFVIFGWSGIAATFCPTMILSLFWRGMTAKGALAAMVTGFVCVPLFKFGAPLIWVAGPYLAELAELPPAFLLSGLAGIAVSLMDPKGRARVQDVQLKG